MDNHTEIAAHAGEVAKAAQSSQLADGALTLALLDLASSLIGAYTPLAESLLLLATGEYGNRVKLIDEVLEKVNAIGAEPACTECGAPEVGLGGACEGLCERCYYKGVLGS